MYKQKAKGDLAKRRDWGNEGSKGTRDTPERKTTREFIRELPLDNIPFEVYTE